MSSLDAIMRHGQWPSQLSCVDSQHHITEEWPTKPHIACNKDLRILKHIRTIEIRTHHLKQITFAFAEASCE